MEKAKKGKSLVKELNQNLKEIEELQQKRQTTEIQKLKVQYDSISKCVLEFIVIQSHFNNHHDHSYKITGSK